jgi:hypothetical protein
MWVKTLAAFAAVTTVACSSVSLPPKAGPEDVAMINPAMGQAPDDGYKVIGPVTVTVPIGTENREILTLLRAEAAELGADAVILESITAPQSLAGNTDREEGIIGRGRAIYWPAPTTN